MARPAVEIDEEFMEKLSRRNERQELPSQLEHVYSHVERIYLQDVRDNYGGKAEMMLALLKKFNNTLPVIEDVEVRQNSFNLAKIAKDKFVKFAIQNWIKNPDPEIPELSILLPLAFNDDENCFDFSEFSEKILKGEVRLNQDRIPDWQVKIREIAQEMEVNNQNVR